MTETVILPPPTSIKQSLFRGLNYYTEAESDRFFGRSKETQQLYQLIKYNVLTLVFGKSGTGKTSLLNAGVFPLLREDDCLPFPIRLKFGEGNPSLKEQVVQVLTQKIEQDGFSISSFNADDTLWEFFHREDLWKVITPVLIFDQFEEIFTLLAAQSPKTAELTALFTELSDLIENTIPEQIKAAYLKDNETIPFNYKRQRAKVIFAFREDFLPEMESITSFIPSVKNSRFRLLPMTAQQAYEVITKTWRSTIQGAEARKVVFYLTNNEEAGAKELPFQVDTMALFEIEPSLLSQVCSYLETKRAEENLNKISAEFLQKYPKETILRTIYYDALQAGEEGNGAQIGSEMNQTKSLKTFLENNLINEEGYRIKYDRKEINPALLPGIGLLKSHYFIREEEESIELSHDVIANIVKADRDERRRTQAEAEAKVRAKKRAAKILFGAGIVVLIATIGVFFYSKNRIADAKQKEITADKKVESAETLLKTVQDSIKNARKFNKRVVSTNDFSIYKDSINRLNRRDSFLTILLNHYKEQEQTTINNIVKYYSENVTLKTSLSNRNKEYESIQNKLNSILRPWHDYYSQYNNYQSHLDAIYRFREIRDTTQLYYHIDLLKRQNFKDKLKRQPPQ